MKTPRTELGNTPAQFLKACPFLGIYFWRHQILNAKNAEMFNSSFARGAAVDLSGCNNLDDEDVEHLFQAMENEDPETFRAYLRKKYGLEDVYSQEERQRYQRYLKRQRIKSHRRKRLSPGLILKVFRRDGFKCKVCGGNDHLTIDHILPHMEGGKDTAPNLQTLCRGCNSKKGDKV